jgi:Helix-turn-helix domain
MRRNTKVTFAMRDLDRLKCIQAVVDGDLKLVRASERLGLTTRQVRRLARRYAAGGPVGLVSKRFNRPSNNRLDEALADRVIKLLRSTYADFGPTLATEKLRTKYGIDLAKETVRRLQIAVGLWIPRKLRPPKIQQPRMRRACIGELIQIDGCEHHWFEERGPASTALVYIDDATSRLMQILFTGSESTFGYFEATRQYLLKHGKPLAFYSDKASIFRVNHASATGGDGHTQFARALYELNIDGICANTPAAKGRVERAHLTMQDRLVKELRLEGISTIDAANAFMPTYVEDYNALFAKLPREAHDAHRPIRDDENLDSIFSWREQRKVTSNLTLHYERKLYLLQDTPDNRRYAGKYLDVYQFPDGRIEIRAAGVSVPYSTYDKLGAIDQGAIVENKRLGHALRISGLVQSERDNHSYAGPSTAHRIGGSKVPRNARTGKKTQRELNQKDLQKAIEVQS